MPPLNGRRRRRVGFANITDFVSLGMDFYRERFMAAEAEKRDSIWKKGKLLARGRSPKQAVTHDSVSLASGMKAIGKKYYPVLVQIDAIATFYASYRK